MSLVSAAVVPSAPLLVPALAGGSADLDRDLRAAVMAAVAGLVAAGGPVVVVGAAPRTGACEGTWDWSGFGVRARGGDGASLPLSLAVGAWLLDQVSPDVPRTFVGVDDADSAEACRRLGARLGTTAAHLLVVGDGSARRDLKAPGHFDARAEPFDRDVEQALRDGLPDRLLALSPEDARSLLAQGRAPWQVMAGAVAGGSVRADLPYAGAPYGVGYLVATWAVRP